MQLGRYMEKGSIRKLVIFSALAIILVILTLIQDSFLSYSFGNEGGHNFQNRRISLPSSQPLETESIKLQLSRLAKGKQLTELESTGISCSSDSHTDECLINKPIIFDKQSLTIYIPSNDQTPPTKKKIKPYPRKDDQSAMDRVSPLHIMHGNIKKIEAPACEFWHNVPAMIFSFGGFSENTYHEFNELIIPLFLTTRHFKSEVQFVVTDYRSRWIRKLSKALKNLSRYEIIDADVDETVHCFPAAIVGLSSRPTTRSLARSHSQPEKFTTRSTPKGKKMAAPAMEGMAVTALRSVMTRVRQAAERSGRDAGRVRVVAVSKTKPISLIRQVYDAGHRCFGENYAQELMEKGPQLPEDIEWHFIGHLQTNKVKSLLASVPHLDMVEGVDSAKLANHLDRAVSAIGRNPLKVFIQVNTSGETSKSGVDPPECVELVKHVTQGCLNLKFCGLMTIGMPDYSSTPENFKSLSDCRLSVCKALGIAEEQCELSMGMSGDFEQAIEMGSTNVRIGSTIFGPREYPKKQAK